MESGIGSGYRMPVGHEGSHLTAEGTVDCIIAPCVEMSERTYYCEEVPKCEVLHRSFLKKQKNASQTEGKNGSSGSARSNARVGPCARAALGGASGRGASRTACKLANFEFSQNLRKS